jgi:ABC-type Mn2+/Zn2+ transport system permease subunit
MSDAVLLLLIGLVATAALSVVSALLAMALFIVPAATVRMWSQRLLSWQLGSITLVAIEGTTGF